MTDCRHTFDWMGPSNDLHDEQFGHVVELASIDDADRFDAVLVGEPFDRAVIGRTGASEGPAALRQHLAGTKTHHFDAGPVGSVADLGDVTLGDSDPDEQSVADLQARVRTVAERVHDTDAFPVFLGGDNSMTYPNAAPLLDDGSLGVINFDAHLDVREVREDRGPTSGTPYRQLYDEGLDAYACVGARHFETSTDYAEYVRERGGEVVTAEEVGDDEVEAIDRALDAMEDVDRLYVSVDLDVLDASAAPGVSAPTPGGVSSRELFRMLRLAGAEDRLAGFEVVECAPALESGTANLTATAGARAVAHLLSARPSGESSDATDGHSSAGGRR
ncbi:formimidoylglutamase [Halorussus gelatinilyticus]|uniref:Formimidoylglutamase n=1 Tax=Halorussus gelatinilyticus TaxID=2937524 RepID=A0A8U0ILD0_9EURY|nr:formimidoylglutamase [Halorussus gelatinilyticus]UPW01943.1 formimidoylglutamase [Halorussus gelatinilyticus]